MEIIKVNKDITPTEIENNYIDTVMSGNEHVAIEITDAQAEKMDLEDDGE